MFDMRISTLTHAIVRGIFQQCSPANSDKRQNEALHINFDVRMDDYELKNARIAKGLHLLYWCPPSSSYITVFSGVTASPFDDFKKVQKWTHEVTHDCCWTDTKVDNDLYFAMAAELNGMRVAAGLKRKAPVEFSQYAGFPAFRENIYRWVPVSVTKDSTDTYSYRRVLTLT